MKGPISDNNNKYLDILLIMNDKLALKSESLNSILDGRKIKANDTIHNIWDAAQHNPDELFQAAQALRAQHKGRTITFSKKAFFNLVNLCQDTCSYCTYKADPQDTKKLSLMSKQNVDDLLDTAARYHCVEALFVTGESPEQRYQQARDWLQQNGFSSTTEYIIHCSESALQKGLFPHTNAGNLTRQELAELQKSNPSMGLMLENTSQRLTQKGMPHHMAASKNPKNRIQVLKDAGQLHIPMTTGVLLGIGETPKEAIDTILEIKKLHDTYHNIQEIIIQNFEPKSDTVMWDAPSTNQSYFKMITAITRLIMPDMNIQIPPNLSPTSYQTFLQTGINDWGGVSPLTPDHVNPEFSWPKINDIQYNCEKAGFNLECRFPVYPEFVPYVNQHLQDKMKEIADEDTRYVQKSYWRDEIGK